MYFSVADQDHHVCYIRAILGCCAQVGLQVVAHTCCIFASEGVVVCECCHLCVPECAGLKEVPECQFLFSGKHLDNN